MRFKKKLNAVLASNCNRNNLSEQRVQEAAAAIAQPFTSHTAHLKRGFYVADVLKKKRSIRGIHGDKAK